tara:strand:- start:8612 stop:10135 length:1524 start_codon:yes stop_codon:yes gene_type:complete
MIYRKIFISIFLLIFFNLPAQELSAIIIDSLDQQPIPFVTITSNFDKNTITNEEGKFRLFKDESFSNFDSIYISSIGYKSLALSANRIDVFINLSPSAIELEAVTVTNREKLTAIQIINKVKENAKNILDFDYVKRKVFWREITMSETKRFDVKIKKSSIKEFDQKFMDSITSTIPKKNNFYIEVLSDFYGNKNPENQKINSLKSAELINKETEISLKTIENKIQPIVDLRIKPDSYFKFRSGIFPVDIEAEGVDFRSVDSTDTAQLEKINNKKLDDKKDFNSTNRNFIKKMSNSFIDYKKKELYLPYLEVFKRSRKFDFKLVGLSYLGYDPIYIIDYNPKSSKGKYKGKIYVHADDFALIRIDYENIRMLRDFSLLGVSFKAEKRFGKRIFKKNDNGKYDLYFSENNFQVSFGLDRPLKIIEKNKNVRGRRKQNELTMQINFNGTTKVNTELIFIETNTLKHEDYKKYKEINSDIPFKLKEYDPNFWKGYNIVEPNEVLKEFKIEN